MKARRTVFYKRMFKQEYLMKKWYFQLKSEKRGRIPPIEKAKKLQLKNNLKKHLKYVKLLMLRRFSLSYPKKYKNVAGILIQAKY